MADSENSAVCDLRNAQINVGTLIYEIRTVLEALSHGLKTLLKRTEAEPVKGELLILENFANQAVDALDSDSELIAILLSWPAEPSAQAS